MEFIRLLFCFQSTGHLKPQNVFFTAVYEDNQEEFQGFLCLSYLSHMFPESICHLLLALATAGHKQNSLAVLEWHYKSVPINQKSNIQIIPSVINYSNVTPFY